MDKMSILKSKDVQVVSVPVPEWGGDIYLRTISGADRDAWEMDCWGRDNDMMRGRNMRAKLLVRAICDEEGTRIFTDMDAADLGQKNAKVLDRLFDRAAALNGLREEDVKELEKNSEDDPSGASGIGYAGPSE